MSGETQNMKTITLKQCSLMLVTVTLLIGLVQASENVYAAGDTIPLQYHCDCYHNATQKKDITNWGVWTYLNYTNPNVGTNGWSYHRGAVVQ